MSDNRELMTYYPEVGDLLSRRRGSGQPGAPARQNPQGCALPVRASKQARDAHLGNLAREFSAAVKPQTELLQEITGNVGIVRALHSPKAKAVFVFLKQLDR